MSKYLVLKGCEGIGNRIISLCYAIEYCKKTNRVLLVDWSDGMFSNKGNNIFYRFFDLEHINYINDFSDIHNYTELSKFPEIWGRNPMKSVYEVYTIEKSFKSYPQRPIILRNLIYKFSSRLTGNLSKLWEFLRYNGGIQSSPKNSFSQAIVSLFKKNDIPFGAKYSLNISKDILFFVEHLPPFKFQNLIHIKFSELIITRAEEFKSKSNLLNSYIGIHIRNTDKKPNIEIESLISRLKEMTEINGKNIFLATDNIEVEKLFRLNFSNLTVRGKFFPSNGEAIHYFFDVTAENTMEKELILEDALIELRVLIDCEVLFYQENSSYSRVVKHFRDDRESYNWLDLK